MAAALGRKDGAAAFLQDFVNLSGEGLAGGGKCGIIKEKGKGKASRGKGGEGQVGKGRIWGDGEA